MSATSAPDARRRVMVAMSGGVDSSVAAALCVEAGHDVVGVTLRLWGGESDSGCCSVSDVEDARRVAHQLDIDHHVFNLADDFARHVVGPYVAAHAEGRTPNPCIECNRHLKFDRLLSRATALGFDAVATGHHARVVTDAGGVRRVARGADAAKDQSYVLYMLRADALGRVTLPVGAMTKDEVRQHARRLGLATASKPDSQDVCFITSTAGRRGFLADRIGLHPGRLVDTSGAEVGSVTAVELVTVGQRRGLGHAVSGEQRYALDVDVERRTVVVGTADDLEVRTTTVGDVVWSGAPVWEPGDAQDGAGGGAERGIAGGEVRVQASAHGEPVAATLVPEGDHDVSVRWERPVRRVAPGQSLAFYVDDPVVGAVVIGGGVATSPSPGSAPVSG